MSDFRWGELFEETWWTLRNVPRDVYSILFNHPSSLKARSSPESRHRLTWNLNKHLAFPSDSICLYVLASFGAWYIIQDSIRPFDRMIFQVSLRVFKEAYKIGEIRKKNLPNTFLWIHFKKVSTMTVKLRTPECLHTKLFFPPLLLLY